MTRLTAKTLLEAWERALDAPAAARPAVLAAAGIGQSVADVLGWDIGRRDAALYDLRVQLFGPTADAVSHCPSCSTQLEVTLDLTVVGPDHVVAEPVIAGRYRVHHRIPTTADLVGLIAQPTAAAARAALVQLALVSVNDDSGATVPFDRLSDSEQATVVSAIAAAHDGIDVRLALRCDACDHEWVTPFDIGAFLVRELDAWGDKLLREVHALAGAFGWSESDILALSARRRRAYLDLVGAQ